MSMVHTAVCVRVRAVQGNVENVETLSEEKLEPFDFQNPPKVLQIKSVTLVSKRKKRALPKLVVKETVASKARRYFINRFYVF